MKLDGPVRFLGASVALSMLAGCGLQGPTYGTGTASNVQLMEDVSNLVKLGPNRRDPIAYQPRPELVTPPAGALAALPQPQADVTEREGWVESPEERRARYRAFATANRDNPNFRPAVDGASGAGTRLQDTTPDFGPVPKNIRDQQRAEVLRRRQEAQGGTAANRRYLSEPPLDYRAPASTAPADQLGESEEDKAERLADEAGVERKKRFIFF